MSTVALQGTQPPALKPCRSCGREWGAGIACQFCDQVEGLPPGVALSGAGSRLAAHLLEAVLMVVTLGVGWLVWAAIVFARGQTPAKQVMGMRTVTLRTGVRAGWGRMFVREVIAKWLIGILGVFTLGIVYFWLLWDKNKQELWDKITGTIVVKDAHKQLSGKTAPETPALTATGARSFAAPLPPAPAAPESARAD